MNLLHRLLCIACLAAGTLTAAANPLVPVDLQTENLVDPIAIDAPAPRLSWRYSTEGDLPSGWTQSAYRILVASSPEKLSAGEGDLWDSGKVESDETLGIAYGGDPLGSRARCWWRVKVWSDDGKESDWSEPAMFSTGLMQPSDWSAKWITDQAEYPIIPPVVGYLSALETSPDVKKWIQIDLGREVPMERIVLIPAKHFGRLFKAKTPTLFPKSFRVVAATKADLSDRKVLAEERNVALEWGDTFEVQAAGQTARFLRIEIDRIGSQPLPFFEFQGKVLHGVGLGEIEVWSDGANVALKRPVQVSDAIHSQPDADLLKLADFKNLVHLRMGWAPQTLTDGVTESVMGRTVLRQRPSPLFRKEFEVEKKIERAELHVTSLGSYEAWINGQRVGEAWLTPNWTDFSKEVMVQSYGVSDLVKDGKNVIAALLADGQYRSRPPMDTMRANQFYAKGIFGDAIPRLLMQLEITYSDGSSKMVGTDATWKTWRDGPVQRTSIFDGVDYDARKELPGWKKAGHDDAGWHSAVESAPGWPLKLIAERLEPIEVVHRLEPKSVTEPKPGVFVVDFGRGIAGVCDLTLRGGRPGAEVTLTHAQMLNDDGTVHTGNLWGAIPVDRIQLSGAETVTPHFPGIYHGFRFVQIEGLENKDDLLEIEALALASAAPRAAQFECSDPMLNQLFEMGYWTFRANMPGLVADCAGRDERLPWLGDCFTDEASTFAKYFRAPAFMENEIHSIFLSQGPKGEGSIIAVGGGNNYNPGWSDALVWVPFHAMLHYGGQPQWASRWSDIERFFEYIETVSTGGIVDRYGFNPFGDWLSSFVTVRPGATQWGEQGPAPISREAWGTLWYFGTAKAGEKLARQLGKEAEARELNELASGISHAFVKRFVKPDGTIDNGHQSGYALALDFGILPEGPLREKALQRLLESIESYDGHFATGSLTTAPLLRVLSRSGHHDLALKCGFHPEPPSYRAMVEHADRTSNTIWERYDGYLPELGGPKPEIMNDLTHVGLASVCDWMFETVGGLRPDPENPGFKHFFFEPVTGGGITHASGSYDSVRGKIDFAWKLGTDGKLVAELTVPPNTTATVKLPVQGAEPIMRKVGSGSHRFEAQ